RPFVENKGSRQFAHHCDSSRGGVFSAVKRLTIVLAILVATTLFSGIAFANRPANQASPKVEATEALVFVTGSRIPQRIKVSRIGTATYSPLRVIDRKEIDQTGRRTTAGALVNEPSLRVIGH